VLSWSQWAINPRGQELIKEDDGLAIHTYTPVCQEIGVLNVVAVVTAELPLGAIECRLPLAELVMVVSRVVVRRSKWKTNEEQVGCGGDTNVCHLALETNLLGKRNHGEGRGATPVKLKIDHLVINL
jgi:hypothetical protein